MKRDRSVDFIDKVNHSGFKLFIRNNAAFHSVVGKNFRCSRMVDRSSIWYNSVHNFYFSLQYKHHILECPKFISPFFCKVVLMGLFLPPGIRHYTLREWVIYAIPPYIREELY